MPISYDGRSLVPDISQALSLALGVAQQKAAENKDEARKTEVADLTGQLAASKNPLEDQENLKIIARLNSIDPQAGQFGVGLLQLRDEKKLRATKQEMTDASAFYQAVLDTKDPVERQRFIAQTIRERQESGKDVSKLTELAGLDPTKQTLMARRQIILAGDAKTLADEGLKSLIEQQQLLNAQLDSIQKRQKIEADAREAASGKYSDVASMRDDFVKQSQKYIGVRDAFTSLESALGQASAAGDIAGIFGFMKSIDPQSSVREGEQATAKSAGGVPENIRSIYNEAIGRGGLTPAQRADFLRTARGQLDTAQRSQDKLRSEFQRLAQLRQFNPEEVLVDFSAPAGAAPADAPPTVPASQFPEGTVMKNKTTGRRWVVKGGQWQ